MVFRGLGLLTIASAVSMSASAAPKLYFQQLSCSGVEVVQRPQKPAQVRLTLSHVDDQQRVFMKLLELESYDETTGHPIWVLRHRLVIGEVLQAKSGIVATGRQSMIKGRTTEFNLGIKTTLNSNNTRFVIVTSSDRGVSEKEQFVLTCQTRVAELPQRQPGR